MKDASLRDLMRECSALITEKTQEIYDLVPGYGDLNGNVLVITSYPSAKEEMTGIERYAGMAYDSFLKTIGYSRASVYTTYAVKYRPYKINEKSSKTIDREVTMEEVRMFYSFLVSEIELVKPKVIITLGDLAYSALHNMEQGDTVVYGELNPMKIIDELYQVMAMPHPSETKFSKVLLTEETMKNLQFLEEEDIGEFVGLDELQIPEADEERVVPSVNETPVIYDRQPIPEPKRSKNKISGKHKVILVYGGSQLANDPSYVVAERVSSVLTELNVGIKRIDLYKNEDRMAYFFDELEEADGLIIATTIEWYGIGGLLQTFLDKAYRSGQFSLFEGTYLFNIVISRHSFEREGLNHILCSWEILGGIEGVSLSASIESSADIETNSKLLFAIDKKAEDFYRVINQQRMALPTSINTKKVFIRVPSLDKADEGEQMVMKQVINPAKKEDTFDNQMSFISNYDEFIEKQQKDISDIASLFKERLSSETGAGGMSLSELFEYKFKPDKSFGDYQISWVVNDEASENFILNFKGARLIVRKGRKNDADVIISSNLDVLQKITESKLTIQRAFMTGEVKAKGNFTLLYKLDGLFAF